jgi:ParB family chromosome partitioning protein
VSELTAYRTLALRAAVANNPQVALTALLHKLCLDTFEHTATGNCLEASARGYAGWRHRPAGLCDGSAYPLLHNSKQTGELSTQLAFARVQDGLAVLQ